MSALLARASSSCWRVVPVSRGHRDDGRVRHRAPAHPRRASLLLLFVFGLTLPFEGIITPLYYLVREMGIHNTRLAIVLPLIGLYMPFGVFWMRAHFVNMPSEISEAARVDGANTWELFWRIHVPLARAPIASLGDPACRSGRGTSSCSRWCSSRTPPSARWPARSGRSRATTRPTSRCCAPGRSLILMPTLIVFLIFQRQIISALLQGSVKG